MADLPNQARRAGIHEGIRVLFPKPDALIGESTGRAATWNAPRNGSLWRAHKHGFVAAYRFYADHTWDDAVLVKLDDDIRLVKMKDNMLKLLIGGGEARTKYMHPKAVVPFLENRGGAKM